MVLKSIGRQKPFLTVQASVWLFIARSARVYPVMIANPALRDEAFAAGWTDERPEAGVTTHVGLETTTLLEHKSALRTAEALLIRV